MRKLIIFDMDGVLVDSEPLYHRLEKKIFSELELKISEEEFSSFTGLGLKEMWKRIKKKHEVKYLIDELVELSNKRTLEFFKKQNIEPTSNLITFLNRLSHFELAVASSTSMKIINLILEKINIKNRFAFIISGESLENGKPAPDIFLRVAEKMNYRPADCIVIEDSQNGVKAAKAAGMKCIGYTGTNSGSQDLSMADLIVSDFDLINNAIF